jgi:hypothetical protein
VKRILISADTERASEHANKGDVVCEVEVGWRFVAEEREGRR